MVAEHPPDDVVPTRMIGDHVCLQAVIDRFAAFRRKLIYDVIGRFEPLDRHRHYLAALPVKHQRADVTLLHKIEKLGDDRRQLFVRHTVVGLVLKTILAIDVAFICRQKDDLQMISH